jgi:hypothetical protein
MLMKIIVLIGVILLVLLLMAELIYLYLIIDSFFSRRSNKAVKKTYSSANTLSDMLLFLSISLLYFTS